MGNSESKDVPKSPSTTSSAPGRNRDVSQQRGTWDGVPSARKPFPSSHVTTAPATSAAARSQTPPTANLVAQSSASISTSNATAQATVSAGSAPTSSHSRARSITTTGSKKLKPEELGAGASSHKSETSAMGNAESRHRPPSRSSTLPPPSAGKFQPSPITQPVDVPPHPSHDGLNETEDKDQTSPSASPYGLPASQLSRPPRLPLPIERDPEPSSPIITPQDTVPPPLGNETLEVDEEGQDSYLPRRASLLSSTTLDDEDAADIEQFAVESNPHAQKVPTTLNWKGAAHSVYFTGTFCNWEKKFRLHRLHDGETYTVTMPLAVGTHHITFLVDGEPKVSLGYPTTVDFANALVNYIEVAAPQSPTEEKAQPAPPVSAGPVPIPGKEQELQVEGVDAVEWVDEDIEPSQRDKGEALQPPGAGDEIDQALQESIGTTEPPTAPPAPPQQPTQPKQQPKQEQSQKPKPTIKPRIPRPKYTNEIPDILLHLDLYNTPDDERYRRAQRAIQHLPQPPSLPMFMSKSILNTATPHKDDASVLAMPNHTVLNHLATSSIRNGVLATSGTTRYKRKFLTTIMYKPTSEDG